MLAEAKAVSKLAASGWKPKRTMIYCAWDGEEPGLLGSTEWVETHADELLKHGAVYINTDGNGRGFLGMSGSHTLEQFVNTVSQDVTDPETHVSVAKRARAQRVVNSSGDAKKEALDRPDMRIGALGSGSDYTPFLQHLGIAALSVGYGGEDGGGSYHSIYDSYTHYTRFGDPGFQYGVALAQTAGRMTLRLANADVLPFEFSDFTETVGKYVKEVVKLADDMRESTEDQNRMIRDNAFTLAADPTQTYVVPRPKDPVPFLNFSSLQNALSTLQDRTKEYQQAARGVDYKNFSRAEQQELDNSYMHVEQLLTEKDGLPRRPWFVHQIYAPGAYTGYGVKTLPAVREAIELRNWKEADEQIVTVSKVLLRYADGIGKITNLLKKQTKADAGQ
jgi:N-acetylated-alpha-linked acidic dipeptidase